jgi:hypothetical protein
MVPPINGDVVARPQRVTVVEQLTKATDPESQIGEVLIWVELPLLGRNITELLADTYSTICIVSVVVEYLNPLIGLDYPLTWSLTGDPKDIKVLVNDLTVYIFEQGRSIIAERAIGFVAEVALLSFWQVIVLNKQVT